MRKAGRVTGARVSAARTCGWRTTTAAGATGIAGASVVAGALP